EHWWLKLAELQALAGQDREAVATLEAAYPRFANALVRRLAAPQSPLHALSRSAACSVSSLSATLAEARAALERRRTEAQARLAALPPRPPLKNYIAHDACPGECCSYGAWTALEDVVRYDAPGGSRETARAARGAQVAALTGQV